MPRRPFSHFRGSQKAVHLPANLLPQEGPTLRIWLVVSMMTSVPS